MCLSPSPVEVSPCAPWCPRDDGDEETDLPPNSRKSYHPGGDPAAGAQAPTERSGETSHLFSAHVVASRTGRACLYLCARRACAGSRGQGQSGHPSEPPRGAMVAHCAPGSAGSGEGGAWGAEQLRQREGRDAVIALCSHAAAWEWCARPPPPGKAPCWQGPRCLCPGTRLCLPKTPSPPPSAPPADPPGVSAPVSAAWPRPGRGGQSRRWAGFGGGGQ